ncbi:MAG: CYTH domain-containing protein [Gammaproteobacteria bacterium]
MAREIERLEIERKFLIENDAWRSDASAGIHMRQGYLTQNGPCSVRVRIASERAWLNIKSAALGISRLEFDYPIPLADALHLLEALCVGAPIHKTRYHVMHAGHRWEIDVFEGDNAGLVVAEIELQDPEEPFVLPEWAGEEVSFDPRYYNVSLAMSPYRTW